MDLNIKGKTALITGSDSGLRLETAKFLIKEGVNVVLSDKKDGKELKEAVRQVEKSCVDGAKVMGIAADISKNQEVVDMADKIEKEFGGAHIIFHSAGARGAAGDFFRADRRRLDENGGSRFNGSGKDCASICSAYANTQVGAYDSGRFRKCVSAIR